MSMLKTIVNDIADFIFPPVCPACGEELARTEHFVCTACRFRAPLTNLWMEADNPMVRRLDGLLPVEHASALMWFIDGSPWQEIIHQFKYAGKWRYARELGEWYGALLADTTTGGDVDVVVPVPLHWRRRISRGYNQSELIADGIASMLGVKVDSRSLCRHVNNPSQTLGNADYRWKNADGIFSVRNPQALYGKHLLLVDDIFTTGATMVSCGSAIVKSLGADNVKISIATIAVTQRSMAIDK